MRIEGVLVKTRKGNYYDDRYGGLDSPVPSAVLSYCQSAIDNLPLQSAITLSPVLIDSSRRSCGSYHYPDRSIREEME